MLTILSLFGRSPFAPLQQHMEKVSCCVEKIVDLFQALSQQDFDSLEEVAREISELEHSADLMKNEIRNHLPNSLFLPVDRGNLLEILSLQDSIADRAEDIAVLLTLRQLQPPIELKKSFQKFLDKNLDTFRVVSGIIREWQDLLESSFGGVEAEKVRQLIADVAYGEHEVDLLQRDLLRILYNTESLDYREFDLWMRITAEVGGVSNLSEKLANRIRMTLDLK